MAGTVNKVILIGNVGNDPDIRTFPSGGKVANFSVATSEKWTDKKSGEKKEKTEWHRISVTNDSLAGIVEKYIKKGSKVYIEGQLETRKYEKDGKDVYTTEVVLRPYHGELTMLDSKGGSSNDTHETHKGLNKDGDVPNNNVMDDEIPF